MSAIAKEYTELELDQIRADAAVMAVNETADRCAYLVEFSVEASRAEMAAEIRKEFGR